MMCNKLSPEVVKKRFEETPSLEFTCRCAALRFIFTRFLIQIPAKNIPFNTKVISKTKPGPVNDLDVTHQQHWFIQPKNYFWDQWWILYVYSMLLRSNAGFQRVNPEILCFFSVLNKYDPPLFKLWLLNLVSQQRQTLPFPSFFFSLRVDLLLLPSWFTLPLGRLSTEDRPFWSTVAAQQEEDPLPT